MVGCFGPIKSGGTGDTGDTVSLAELAARAPTELAFAGASSMLS
jgi:hypothetical protein